MSDDFRGHLYVPSQPRSLSRDSAPAETRRIATKSCFRNEQQPPEVQRTARKDEIGLWYSLYLAESCDVGHEGLKYPCSTCTRFFYYSRRIIIAQLVVLFTRTVLSYKYASAYVIGLPSYLIQL